MKNARMGGDVALNNSQMLAQLRHGQATVRHTSTLEVFSPMVFFNLRTNHVRSSSEGVLAIFGIG